MSLAFRWPALTAFLDRLEPPLGALEAAYRQRYLSADIRQTQIVWLCVAAGNLMLITSDYGEFGASRPFYLDAALRVLVSVFLAGLTLNLASIREPPDYDRRVLLGMLVLVCHQGLYSVTAPATDYSAFTFYMALIATCYLMVPAPLAQRLSSGGLTTLFALGVLYLARAPSSFYVISIPSILLFVNVIGLFSSVHIYTYRREQYRANREAAGLNEQLRTLAETDALTGMFNRRKFLELATEEFARYQRYGQPFSLAVIDIDYFKQVNDQFGHAAGDEVLAAVARSLLSGKRAVDQVGRLGGEEFGLLLPQTPLAAAAAVVERIRRQVAATPIHAPAAGAAVTVTFSAGVGRVDAGDTSMEAAMRRADQLLYQAKQQGRNRVEAQPETLPV
jgi:diguanylate cyclase (GGDEF)-like protein